ncbi:hypothetical protein R8Z50_04315 [Longispora sp. K20-0274]|uniref:hypothetical protein n=1 Tax=Longispora sp. K20-0274 TaxID=3088255 RepID=UPI00399C2887
MSTNPEVLRGSVLPFSSAAGSNVLTGRTTNGARNSMMLAGWLFADLALALMVLLLGSATDMPAQALPSPTASASRTPVASATPFRPLGTEQKPFTFVVQTNAQALLNRDVAELGRVRAAIQQHLDAATRAGRRVAFVLTFGTSESPGAGVSLARIGNDLLREATPAAMTGAAVRDFWQATGQEGAAEGALSFELYFFVTQ